MSLIIDPLQNAKAFILKNFFNQIPFSTGACTNPCSCCGSARIGKTACKRAVVFWGGGLWVAESENSDKAFKNYFGYRTDMNTIDLEKYDMKLQQVVNPGSLSRIPQPELNLNRQTAVLLKPVEKPMYPEERLGPVVGRYATGPCSVSVAAPFFFFIRVVLARRYCRCATLTCSGANTSQILV
jgi:hypothetical protein